MIQRHCGKSTRFFVSALVYAIAAAGCSDGTQPLVPASVQLGGNQQTAQVGAAVAIAPSVKVVTTDSRPVPGVKVTFTPAAESGVVVGGSQVTDASGVARVTSWTLGTKVGVSTLNVVAEGLTPTTITATATAGAAATGAKSAGDEQTAVVGERLPIAPAVTVLDVHGNPVPGVSVGFALQNGGTVERAVAESDANGVASAGFWTLGPGSGTQVLRATPAGGNLTGQVILFSATASPAVESQLVLVREPQTTNASGEKLSVQPMLEFRDRFGNVATSATRSVSASIALGTGTLTGTTSLNAVAGRVTFTDLAYTGTGAVQLRFTAAGIGDVSSASFDVGAGRACAGPTLTLGYAVGQVARFQADAADLPRCLDFSMTRNAGQQYLVMFDNLSRRGSSSSGLFPGVPSFDEGLFDITISGPGPSGSTIASGAARASAPAPESAVHGWQIGGETVYEIEPTPPAGGAPPAALRRDGEWISMNSLSADPVVGDTISVFMEAIPRLGIPARVQRALIRLVTPDVIIAEDVRFHNDPTFTRASGGRNSPIDASELSLIAAEYAKHAKPQADLLFGGRHNAATEAYPGRPIAVHSMMFADNVWGYTYSNTNYFVWDYWVTTTGSTPTIYQNAQINADKLFMHEVAHMRHFGVMERAGRPGLRGNTWLVEGFARFSERLPIASRLLGTSSPSRTANTVLPLYPALAPNFFYDDVPSYREVGGNMYGGYGASSFVFDYLADQVANAGGNWLAALNDFLINGGSETDLNAAIAKYLPGVDFVTLFARARVALFTDDLDAAGLPAWTQYLQYRLRESRPTSPSAEPRALWPKLRPGEAFNQSRTIANGTAYGYVIDGTAAVADARIDITPSRVPNGAMTIVRIR